jgi:hypothetical protein
VAYQIFALAQKISGEQKNIAAKFLNHFSTQRNAPKRRRRTTIKPVAPSVFSKIPTFSITTFVMTNLNIVRDQTINLIQANTSSKTSRGSRFSVSSGSFMANSAFVIFFYKSY